jgi:protein FrlC
MITAYQTFSYLNYPFEEVLKRLARIGYKGVEISAASECGTFNYKDLDEKRAKAVVEQSKSLGLKIVSYDCELLPASGWNLASPYENIRKRTVEYICKSAIKAEELTAPVMVIVAGRVMYGTQKSRAWDWVVEGLKECAKVAHDHNVSLGLEHLTLLEGNVVVTLEDLIAMIEDVAHPGLQALLDTGHVNVTKESMTDYIYGLGDKLKHIHLDDNDGNSDDHLPPGMGNMDFAPMFKALKNIGYKAGISVEPSFGFSLDPDTAAKKGIEFFKQHL